MADHIVIDGSAWMTSHDVAGIVGISEATLRNWRVCGKGPRYLRLGRRGGAIRYRRTDVEMWLSSCYARSA